MATITNNITKDFTTLPNAIIQDDSISDRARFLFVYMATKPNDWQFYQKPLCSSLGWSPDTLRKYMKELTDTGWVTCNGQRLENGKFSANNYTLHAAPCLEKPYRKNSDTGKFRHGKIPTLTKERLIQKKDLYKTESEHTHTTENPNNPKQQNETQGEARRPESNEVDFVQVAKEMADYFENDEQGKAQWAFMCETKRIKVSPIAITSQWAAKHCDSPYMLKNWRKQVGKIINWIQKPSQKAQPHFRTQSNNTEYTPPKNVKRAAAPKTKATSADIEKITRNAKYL